MRAFRRLVWVLSAAASMMAAPVAAQPRWTETDVVQRTVVRSPEIAAAQASHARAQAAAVGAELAENPSASFEREQILADPARAHDVLALRVPLDPSGRRPARRALARFDAVSAGLSATEQRRISVAEALDAFWLAIALGERVAIAERAEAALTEANRVMTRREGEGEASGYERTRLAIAAELARSRLVQARTESALSRARLMALVDPTLDRAPLLVGTLQTRSPPDLQTALDRALRRRRELAVATRAIGLAREAEAAAAMGWLPSFALVGGWNVERGDPSGNGFVAAIELDLPVFARGQDVRAESEAAVRQAAVSAQAVRARIGAAVRVAHARLIAARAELDRLAVAVAPHVETLAGAAAAGYREGERTLLELVDAQATITAVEERRLELALEAQRAEVALRIAMGELP